MKRITAVKFDQLQMISPDSFNHFLPYSYACDLWSMACYYNGLQNDFVKADEEHEVVKSFQLFDEVSKEVTGFNVRAHRKFNRVQWFKLLLGSELCAYSRQQLTAIVV